MEVANSHFASLSLLQALLLGGPNSLPHFLSRHTITEFGIVVDPCAAILVLVVTGLLCAGIKEVFSKSLLCCKKIFYSLNSIITFAELMHGGCRVHLSKELLQVLMHVP